MMRILRMLLLPICLTAMPLEAVEFAQKPSGLRIDKVLDVPLPVDTVWRHWTTQVGVQGFFAPQARVELRPGGPYEMHFNPGAAEGERGSEGTVVMTWLPEELLVFSWNAPTTFGPLRQQHTWVVLRFERLGDQRTRLKFTHYGFGPGAEWAKVHAYFQSAWGFVLGNYEKYAKTQVGTPAP